MERSRGLSFLRVRSRVRGGFGGGVEGVVVEVMVMVLTDSVVIVFEDGGRPGGGSNFSSGSD